MTKHNHKGINNASDSLKEVVFGVEDGMVSTLGAITGIAVGSQDHFTVVLSGLVIISVESISMGVGSFLSNASQEDMRRQAIREEKEELRDNPVEEQEQLYKLLVRDGWHSDMAKKMVEEAKNNKHLMLKEMKYRELNVFPRGASTALRNGLTMFFSYVVGGIIPLFAYFLFSISQAMTVSIIITLCGLFLLGVATTKYTKASWIRSGSRIFLLGGLALLIGLVVGQLVKTS